MRDARVRRIRRLLAQRSARLSEGAFVVEGVNVLDAALDGDADFEALFAAPEADGECPELLDRAARRGIAVHRLGRRHQSEDGPRFGRSTLPRAGRRRL